MYSTDLGDHIRSFISNDSYVTQYYKITNYSLFILKRQIDRELSDCCIANGCMFMHLLFVVKLIFLLEIFLKCTK